MICKVFSSSKTVWINYHICLYLLLLLGSRIIKLMVKSWIKQKTRMDQSGWLSGWRRGSGVWLVKRWRPMPGHRRQKSTALAHSHLGKMKVQHRQIFCFFKESMKPKIFMWKLMVLKQQVSFLNICVVQQVRSPESNC